MNQKANGGNRPISLHNSHVHEKGNGNGNDNGNGGGSFGKTEIRFDKIENKIDNLEISQ